jgi:hypothetical protein
MPRAQKKCAGTTPTWHYDAHRAILRVHGDSFIGDLRYVKELIATGQVPFTIDAIVHWLNGLNVPMILVGHFLSEWVIAGVLPDYLWHFTGQALLRKSA